MSVPTVVGTVTQATVSGVAKTPTGAAAGDLLLFFVSAYGTSNTIAAGSTTFTPPAGAVKVISNQTIENNNSAGLTTVWCYALALVGTPASTYTFTLVPNGTFGGTNVATICLRGVSFDPGPTDAGAGAPVGNNGGAAGGSALSTPAVVTSFPTELLVWYYFGQNQTVTSAPSGFTQQLNVVSSGNVSGSSEGMWTKTQTTAGSTGSVTATAGGDNWIALMIPVVGAGSMDALGFGTDV